MQLLGASEKKGKKEKKGKEDYVAGKGKRRRKQTGPSPLLTRLAASPFKKEKRGKKVGRTAI